MPYKGVPNIRKRLVGSRLRKLREGAQMSVEEAAAKVDVAVSTLRRQETGHTYVSVADVQLYARVYGLDDAALLDRLELLARHGRKRGWWVDFGETARPDAVDYADIEDIATSITTYQPSVVPTLLQTAEYTRVLLESGQRFHHARGWSTEDMIRLRELRKKIMDRAVPPDLHVVIAETAFKPGGRDVIARQAAHILAYAERPNVTVQVVPLESQALWLTNGPMTILHFDRADDGVAYFESGLSSFLDDPDQTPYYRALLEDISKQALSAPETARYLRGVASRP